MLMLMVLLVDDWWLALRSSSLPVWTLSAGPTERQKMPYPLPSTYREHHVCWLHVCSPFVWSPLCVATDWGCWETPGDRWRLSRKKEGLQNVAVALFSPFPSGSASLVCLSHSLKRRLVTYRCLLSSEAFSLPRSLNCMCVTERKRSNLQPVSTPHISSRESAKKVGNCVGSCVSPQSGHCVRNATVRRWITFTVPDPWQSLFLCFVKIHILSFCFLPRLTKQKLHRSDL